MRLLPLAAIGFGARSHLSALWWLGLLYRRPARLHKRLRRLPRGKGAVIGLALHVHAIPYMVLCCALGRLVLVGLLDLRPEAEPQGVLESLAAHLTASAAGIALGIVLGIAYGIVGTILGGIARGIAGGIAARITRVIAAEVAGGIGVAIGFGIPVGIGLGIGFGIPETTAGGIALAIPLGITLGIALGMTVGIASRFGVASRLVIAVGIGGGIAVGIAVGTAVGIAGGTAGGIALGIVLALATLRAFYHPVHLLFLWPVVQARHYRWHPVAWDDLCSIPFPGLDRLLVAYAEESPRAAAREIERLISSYPSQRMQALRARATLLARECGRESELARLDRITGRLPEGEKGFLGQTPQVRQMVGEISRLQARLNTVDRAILREPIAHTLRTEIENFRHRIGGFHEPLASEFRAAAENWLKIADRQWEEARAVTAKEPTPQVFRAGDPVDRDQEAFVSRDRVVGQLEQQVMLATRCPGVLLYGRRRMGKSTVLRNLVGFLPPSVRVVTVSMQDPTAFRSVESFVELVVGRIREAMREDTQAAKPPSDLAGFFDMLGDCNDALGAGGRRLLIALDEYENLDEKIGAGVFTEDLLATLRESIQSHRQLTWAFAGSHDITELGHAPWASYLVSVRTIEVPPFSEAETHLLLTEPLKHSQMWERDDPKRPRFEPAFWGQSGIERIHAEAGGWPHLVQLIAETTVDLVNDSNLPQATPGLLEQALDTAIVRGELVLRQLMEGECSLPREWDYLRDFRRHDLQPPPGDESLERSLRRRLLIAEENDQWRLRVPLMQRWLHARG